MTDRARQLYWQAPTRATVHNRGAVCRRHRRQAGLPHRLAMRRPTAASTASTISASVRAHRVDQNLAQSYKWFALAAQQGDQDSAKKRDDVASRLDQQSLVAARLAVQTWAADLPPDEAMNVKAPAGGWDQASGAPAKPAATVRRKPTAI